MILQRDKFHCQSVEEIFEHIDEEIEIIDWLIELNFKHEDFSLNRKNPFQSVDR